MTPFFAKIFGEPCVGSILTELPCLEFYRGVGTTPEVWPGTIIVLVPLPLFISVPLTAEPGTMTDSGEPAVPVTRPGPREVVMDKGLAEEAGCASAGPVITVRATVAANRKLIIS
jgi:hypothetical protein